MHRLEEGKGSNALNNGDLVCHAKTEPGFLDVVGMDVTVCGHLPTLVISSSYAQLDATQRHVSNHFK